MPRKKKFRKLGKLASGETVYDRRRSHIHENVGINQLKEVLRTIQSRSRKKITHCHDFGHVVGQNTLVEVKEGERVFFAIRKDRPKSGVWGRYYPFVERKTGVPATTLTVVLRWYGNHYRIWTAYYGYPYQYRGGGEYEEFWENHAFVWGLEPHILNTRIDFHPHFKLNRKSFQEDVIYKD